MGIICCATSNSNSGGIGDEETDELIVRVIVVKELASLVLTMTLTDFAFFALLPALNMSNHVLIQAATV
jgi:hypothetical protein